MPPLLSYVLAALASVALGFAGARSFRSVPPRPAASGASPARPAPSRSQTAPADDSPAASKQRIDAVLALGEKHRELAEDGALFDAIQKLDAHDLLAGADDFAALLKKQDSPSGGEASEWAEAWIERWLEVDAPSALRWLRSSSVFKQQPMRGWSVGSLANGVPGTIYKVLARRQPAWLRNYVATLKPEPERDMGIYQLLSESARQDAAGARQLLAEYSDGPNRPAAVQGCVAGLAEGDFRAAFDLAVAETTGRLQYDLLGTVFNQAASRGTGALRELLDRIEDPALRRTLAAKGVSQMRWASRENPLPLIMEELQRGGPISAEGGYNPWLSAVGQAVAEHDGAPAADWALTLPNDPGKAMLSSILSNWSSSEGAELRTWLAGHAAGLDPLVVEKLGPTLTNMARNHNAATRAWAAALPPGGLREQAQFQIALNAGVEGDLQQTAAAYESVAASDAKGLLADQLATVLARQDGAAAAEWAMSLPDGSAREAAIDAVARRWSASDPRGAAEWLDRMPPGMERDAAVREYAEKVAFADPATASEWVAQVADPKVRAEAAGKVFQTWNREDSIASRAWLRALPGVDEKWRADFLKKVK